MPIRRKHRTELGIMELAVDPADVDRRTYPVTIRLSRPLTDWEVAGLAAVEPGLHAVGDAIVVPDARLDDVARERDAWNARLERAQSLADELEGESWVADHRRVDRQSRHGSHLRSQQADDRGLH
ncbi:hypothetical protein J2X46_003418 [Nocardioides sp. BE266]|uniref:hypothetical protein n=1 Tax=Nocardioides sp. BE266 TaxID=2817725 RepID=UPI00285C22EA|nr:hypothetical protein [Nocardioides sp. BE266]MDR7254425.1 hypothetical protein [Nocardioides sp. BE266]